MDIAICHYSNCVEDFGKLSVKWLNLTFLNEPVAQLNEAKLQLARLRIQFFETMATVEMVAIEASVKELQIITRYFRNHPLRC